MTTKGNSFVGISSGSAVTTGNSGGTSGDAFDAVSGTVTVQSSADITAAYDRGLVPALSSSTASYVQWSHTALTEGWFRFYLRVSSLPGATTRLARGYSSATVRWEIRLLTTGQLVFARGDGNYMAQTTGNLSTNTIYRVEGRLSTTVAELQVFAGEDTTSLAITDFGTYEFNSGTWDSVRFGLFTSANATYSAADLAAVAWSDTGWIGPAAIAPVSLTVAGASHAHTAGAPSLTQHHALAVQGAAHSHTADAPTLTQHHTLTVASATHGHAASSPTLTAYPPSSTTLTVADASHGHTATAPTLTQHHTLTVADASHGHSADAPTLTAHAPGGVTLTVADASHGHMADAPALTQHHMLTVQDASHAHTAETPTLTQHHTLTVASATHGHAADTLTLTASSAPLLTVAGAVHAHTATTVTLTATVPFTPAAPAHSQTPRPRYGTTARPSSGTTPRPHDGVTTYA